MANFSSQPTKTGLRYWMSQVLVQADKAAEGFGTDPVHDLRTALRRCRSVADGLMVFDSDPAIRKMRKAAKDLFQSLGVLRDIHVLKEWVQKLAPAGDESARLLQEFLDRREQELRAIAQDALKEFDREKWSGWIREVPERAGRIPLDGSLFAHLALQRWHEARALHRRALRDRTIVAFHDLRIGVKRYRYIVENFLPSLHEFWKEDLKEVQDALGDVHDLDVLWSTSLASGAFRDELSRERWRTRIQEVRRDRLVVYRSKMVGKESLWPVWRKGLPQAEELRDLGLKQLEMWASSLDPDVQHSRHVAQLSVQLFDGLADCIPATERHAYRQIVRGAALMHEVGRAKAHKGHHKISARLIRQHNVPLGWTADELHATSLVARYHRGALPGEQHLRFVALSEPQRWIVQLLGGIVRFACTCDSEHDAQIRHVDVESSTPVLRVRAEGYNGATVLAEEIAAARHLLEIAYQRPVFVLPAQSHAA
jgi:CHAD domain-containing protein